ncbi:tektin-like protein 1 [Pseudophryne corroboree]|uniref:tektin-like protein 1 n=1 Tax=Pseudophryne corroboree TaxID=495146 RepID=UPI00308129C3
MAVTPVGSATWRDASYKTVRLAHNLRLSPISALTLTATGPAGVRTQDENPQMKSVQKQQATPPPYNRDLIINTCNDYARGYMREMRSSMYTLRQALLEINRHILRLQKDRDVLEQSLANTRRDILLNNDTVQLRTSRPVSERHPDRVDVLLQDEKKSLMDIKRQSERRLQEISRQLQELHSHRHKLSGFCKEKGLVLDFIGEDGRPNHLERDTTGSSKPLSPENADCRSAIASARATCAKLRYAQPCNGQKLTDRQELKENVTNGLRKKAEESGRIREDVTLAMGWVRNSIQREQRIRNEIETSYQLQLGPVSNKDLCTCDRLDRPLLRILQRHPATQVPESGLILQDSASFQRSLSKAAERVGDLHDTQAKLQDDQRNKLWGERLDRAAVRLRVRSARCRSERLCL